jgi:hypothetical protein
MHPIFHDELAAARVADLHQHAARERTAKAAIQRRRARTHHRTGSVPGHAITGLARRALTLFGGRRPSPTR